MFYSHAFLARKAPLGTVWIAAHLQHKLRKSQVAVADISSSVECIMFPEVPIALRLSGHLLLGVVRIYSKKVDYLYHDCNEVLTHLRTTIASVQLNLPEDASHAPFYSITLPETFELDSLDMDDFMFQDTPDNHLKSHEQITIADPFPFEGSQYVTFSLDEDSWMNSSPGMGFVSPSVQLMDEDILPPSTADFTMGQNSDSLHHPYQYDNDMPTNQIFDDLPEPEKLREVAPEIIPSPTGLLNFHDDVTDHISPVEPRINQKDSLTPTMEEEPTFPIYSTPDPGSFPHIPQIQASFDVTSEEIRLQPSPPMKPKPKTRKRKSQFDGFLVLTNECMKKQLHDTNKIVRKRKKLPCSSLDIWRHQKRLQPEEMFFEPTTSGMCYALHVLFKKDKPVSKLNVNPALPVQDAVNNEFFSGAPDIEIHRNQLESEQGLVDSIFALGSSSSPSGREFSPLFPSNAGLEPSKGMTQEKELSPTLDNVSVDFHIPQFETPDVHTDFQFHEVDGNFPDNLAVPSSTESETEELLFLEADNTPAGSQEHEVNRLSVRARAVAHYLMKNSPTTQNAEGLLDNTSLNRILEGKTRRQCGRMFSEILVLKSYGFIDVRQEKAYEDITLSLTSLSKTIF